MREDYSANIPTSKNVPGTVNIYSSAEGKALSPKTTSENIVLVPQASDSINDPLNWPRKKKVWNFLILAVITGFTAATSNDAGAAQDSLYETYGISYSAMNDGAGILFVAIGWTTFLLTPLVSLYGRKISYVFCISVGLIGSIWFALCKTPLDRLWFPLFVGASEGCAEAHVQQSLMDMYFQHQLGTVLTFYILATSVGTFLGPLFAGLVVDSLGYAWVGWTAAIISLGLLCVIVFGMHETMFDRKKTYTNPDSDVCEKPRTEKAVPYVDANASNISISSHNDIELANETCSCDEKISYWKSVALITKSSNLVGTGFKQYFKRLLRLFRVFLFPPTLFSGLVWGMQDALLTFYLTVEDDQYYDPPFNFGDQKVALINIPCLIGATIGCVYAGVVSDWFTIWMAKKNGGVQEAEYRLYFLIIPALLTPIGLILFAVGTDRNWPWFPTYFGLGLIGVGFGSSGDVSMGYLMDAYPDMVIEMMAGVSVVNNMFGCIFTFACSPWLESMGITMTFTVLAVLTFVVMSGAVPFIIYGKRIRRWTEPWYLEYCERRDNMEQGQDIG